MCGISENAPGISGEPCNAVRHISPSKEANLTLLIERNIDFTVRESSIIQENKIKVEKHYIGGHVNKPCIDKKSTSQGLRH